MIYWCTSCMQAHQDPESNITLVQWPMPFPLPLWSFSWSSLISGLLLICSHLPIRVGQQRREFLRTLQPRKSRWRGWKQEMKKPEEVSSRVAETSLGSGWELDDSGFVTLLKDLSNDEGRACDCKGFSFLRMGMFRCQMEVTRVNQHLSKFSAESSSS